MGSSKTDQDWKRLPLFAALIFLAAILWACGATQPAAAPTAAPVAQPTDTPAVAAAVTTTVAATVTAPTTSTHVATTTPTTTTAATSTNAETRVFAIDQSKSQARFTLNEVLMGAPKTVVGTTSLVSGTISIDLAYPTKTTIGPLQIDARDFQTDSSMRNGAIRRFILQTAKDENRYIVFTPKSIEGLPTTAKAGDTFEFKINGDLTISGVTKPVTFTTSVKAESDTELTGLAKTQVLRSDFNLTIPNVPSVANVTDEVQLELQFAAQAE